MSDETIRVGINSRLLGNEVRYDGGHKLDRYMRNKLGAFVAQDTVCPEVGYGLPTPRESLRSAARLHPCSRHVRHVT